MSDDVQASESSGGGGKPVWLGVVVALAILLLPAYGIFTWFLCRIEVPPGHIAVLVAKTGEELPMGHVLARPGEKGIQLDILKPGRHFRNPLFWQVIRHPRTGGHFPYVNIPQGKVGVLTRLYGESPADFAQSLLVSYEPDGPAEKGLVAEILKPGQWPINPYAYRVDLYPAVEIVAGYVGVVCNMVGKNPEKANTYLVEAGERGVQRKVLRQGAHYLNPYAVRVYPVDIRNQRLEFSNSRGAQQQHGQGDTDGEEANLTSLRFPSSDGFEIEAELTIEYSVDAVRAPEVFVRIGTGDPKTLLAEVRHKALIPALRGIARVQGSKYPAANYISGESRTVFQTSVFDELKEVCAKQGIVIHSVLVNDIHPPDDIADPIRQREVAKEELARNNIQLEQAKAEQSLARQTMLVDQERAKVLAETEKKKRKIETENAQRVALIEQEKLLAVAKADLQASRLEAQAILARGKAEAAVIVANNEAEAKGLEASVAAFKTPAGFAAYTFAQRMAPSVGTVFADPDGPFGQLFRDLLKGSGK